MAVCVCVRIDADRGESEARGREVGARRAQINRK